MPRYSRCHFFFRTPFKVMALLAAALLLCLVLLYGFKGIALAARALSSGEKQ